MQFTILLVEDNTGDIRLAREVLCQIDAPVNLDVATTGAEALAYLRREGEFSGSRHPDLVLLDLNLPRVDGRVVLETMKHDAGLEEIPVIVLTASSSVDDINSSYNASANCFITKPINYDDYVRVMEHIIDYWLVKLHS